MIVASTSKVQLAFLREVVLGQQFYPKQQEEIYISLVFFLLLHCKLETS